jgi:hypothetical protein
MAPILGNGIEKGNYTFTTGKEFLTQIKTDALRTRR